jgi:hypothetical protein
MAPSGVQLERHEGWSCRAKEPCPVLTRPEASQAGDRCNKVIRSVYPTKAASLEANRLRSLTALRQSAPVGVQDVRCEPSRATGALTR